MIQFSISAESMRSSEIRRLMRLASDPSIISFAGGMPGSAMLPVGMIDDLFTGLSRTERTAALQYGPTAGYPPLLESLAAYCTSKGIPLENQEIIITSGGQQAINLISKVLLDPGDLVVTENPSFIGALAAFKSYQAHLTGVALDENGIVIDRLKKVLDTRLAQIKMLYLNPAFQNPSGILYGIDRKKTLLTLLADPPFCIIEDDPYGELYFNDSDRPATLPLKALAPPDLPLCYIGSFAKIFGPGLRLGWLVGPRAIIEKCELAKQSMDACSSSLSQVLAHSYLSRGILPGFLQSVRPLYARRAEIMLQTLEAAMPDGVTWTRPRGGFYIWVTLPPTVDSSDVFNEAVKKGAAFVIGSAFDPYGVQNNCFRLAFSHTPEEKIAEGIRIIAEAVKNVLTTDEQGDTGAGTVSQ
ncbi:MAG: PLP-dependent aminotransferase family protein [Chitinispirillaceae bacterium]|nr:PLP-dependent aminotransferase family protein [Chitinispirillaceae bacterium]